MRKLLFAIVLFSASVIAESPLVAQDAWTTPYPPFRIVGNIYWVGSYDLSSYLVTTPAGHILINTGVGDTAQQIRASIEKLGFKLEDVKILTATHAHYDHVEGLAALKKMTGARLLVSEQDRSVYETGGRTDYLFGGSQQFEPLAVDQTFKDGDTIALGGTALVAHHHGGHTKGATSFTTTIRENGKDYRVIIANMGSINPGTKVTGMPTYPSVGTDYARTFQAQKDMAIDIFLASHASQFRLHDKHKPGDPYNPERFVDPDGFRAAVLRLEKTYLDQLARERAGQR